MKFAWIDERPFNYLDGDVLTGSDVSLARAAFARIGVQFEAVRTTFAELLPGLADGRWDVTTGMFATADRLDLAAFTRPIWSLRDGILLPTRHPGTIDGYRTFAAAGLSLAVLRDQVQAENALRQGLPHDQLIFFDEYDDALSAVLDGRAGGYASVALAHQEHLTTDSSLTDLAVITVPDQEVPPASGAFACASDSTRDALNVALNDLLGDGLPPEPSPDPATWPRRIRPISIRRVSGNS